MDQFELYLLPGLISIFRDLPSFYVNILILLFATMFILVNLRLFGLMGLYSYNAVAIIVANIQALKIINSDVFLFPMALGTIVFSTTFLVSDIITEHYGKEAAKKGVMLTIFAQIIFSILIFITCLYDPAPQAIEISQALDKIFIPSLRLLFASIVAFGLSQLIDIHIFKHFSTQTNKKHLWLRTIIAMSVSGFIDNLVFSSLAWVILAPNPVSLRDLFIIYIFSAYVGRFLVQLVTVPIIYLSYYAKPKEVRHYV